MIRDNKKYAVNYDTLIISTVNLKWNDPNKHKFGYFDTLKLAGDYATGQANKRIESQTSLDYVI